jgi:putative transposase
VYSLERLLPVPFGSKDSWSDTIGVVKDQWSILLPPDDQDHLGVEFSTGELEVKKSRFSEEKIVAVLKQAEAGVKAAELCRRHGISQATLYNWKAKYGGMEPSQLRRLKELEAENNRLKRMYTDLSLTHHALQDAVQRKL